MISDKSMYPEFKPGDYVGGINLELVKNLNQFIGSLCIVTLKNETITTRRIILGKNEHVILCPINMQYEADIVKHKDIFAIASIIWHRKNFIRLSDEY